MRKKNSNYQIENEIYKTSDLKDKNDKLHDMVDQLLQVKGEREDSKAESFDIVSIVRETIELTRFHHKVRDCKITFESPESLELNGIPSQIHQMIFNLIINSADATQGEGKIMVKVLERESDIKIEVQDDGKGISPELRDEIMDPFVTTKEEG